MMNDERLSKILFRTSYFVILSSFVIRVSSSTTFIEHLTRGAKPLFFLACGCSSMVELQPSKLATWVRFPSPAPIFHLGCDYKKGAICSPGSWRISALSHSGGGTAHAALPESDHWEYNWVCGIIALGVE